MSPDGVLMDVEERLFLKSLPNRVSTSNFPEQEKRAIMGFRRCLNKERCTDQYVTDQFQLKS